MLVYRYNVTPPTAHHSTTIIAADDKPRKPGVITTVMDMIARPQGASTNEIMAVLVEAFPDRDPVAMRNTTLLKVNKYATCKDRDESRGLLYYKR